MNRASLEKEHARLESAVAADDSALQSAVDALRQAAHVQWRDARAQLSLGHRVATQPVAWCTASFMVGAWLGYRSATYFPA